jgi:hypothetical protein
MKCPPELDNDVVSLMLNTAAGYGETFTGREFRANAYTLHLDAFAQRICLRRSPVDEDVAIVIQRVVSGTPTTVSSADYYLKVGTRYSEVLLADGAAWPTDQDNVEDTITVAFTTKPFDNPEVYKLAMFKHIAFAYENRGDDPMPLGSNSQRSNAILGYEGALASGAIGLYQSIRIPRI